MLAEGKGVHREVKSEGSRSAIYECICNDSGADVDIPGSDNTGTENINYGVDSKKTIFRRDGFRPET
ncbi:hypothetical protein ABGP60_004679 [Escherichia coli]